MKGKFFRIENKKIFYFALTLVVYELIYWVTMILTNGNLISTYFVTDFNNTSMDYFNMLANMQYDTPYIYNSNYPAMCFLFWKIMYGMIPDLDGIVDGFFLRSYMPAQLGYFLLVASALILLWELLLSFKVSLGIENKLLAVGLVLSGPMLFAFERGNIIIMAFLFLLFFIRFYNSDNKYLRIIAYVCLAVSASLKLYPAFFGILVVQKKRYKEAMILVFLGLLFFILPFFIFDGVQSIKDMLVGMSMATSEQTVLGTGFNYSFNNLIKIFYQIFGLETGICIPLLRIISTICSIFLYFWAPRNWQRIFILSLLCVWLPEISYQYLLILFIIPFLFYLKEEKFYNGYLTYLYGILFVIIMIPIALPSIGDANAVKFPLTLPTFIINMALLTMYILILLESLKKGATKNDK